MLELRYNGCPDCLNTAKAILRSCGYFEREHYRVTFHSDHRDDKIYTVRPDYLKKFTGAILYNTERQSWYDFYTKDRSTTALLPNTRENKDKLISIFKELSK